MKPGPGIEPGTHWWKANALTTAPTLLPCYERHKISGYEHALYELPNGQLDIISRILIIH